MASTSRYHLIIEVNPYHKAIDAERSNHDILFKNIGECTPLCKNASPREAKCTPLGDDLQSVNYSVH